MQLKFRRRERLGWKLGELLRVVWEPLSVAEEASSCVLVPVPLHLSRERDRGYNQATLLARGLTRALARAGHVRVPHLETRCLHRTRATLPQTGLSHSARQENVRGVFAVGDPQKIRARLVVLVDDVMTTGATLSSCAQALKRAGARGVVALTLARATPQFPDGVGPAIEPSPLTSMGRNGDNGEFAETRGGLSGE